jgi:hypothetical protein
MESSSEQVGTRNAVWMAVEAVAVKCHITSDVSVRTLERSAGGYKPSRTRNVDDSTTFVPKEMC